MHVTPEISPIAWAQCSSVRDVSDAAAIAISEHRGRADTHIIAHPSLLLSDRKLANHNLARPLIRSTSILETISLQSICQTSLCKHASGQGSSLPIGTPKATPCMHAVGHACMHTFRADDRHRDHTASLHTSLSRGAWQTDIKKICH